MYKIIPLKQTREAERPIARDSTPITPKAYTLASSWVTPTPALLFASKSATSSAILWAL